MARIAVIEDSLVPRKIVVKVVTDMGHECFEAVNGAEGLDMIRRVRPDLVIMDVMMPKMDGFEVCKAMRADEELRNVRILIMTASTNLTELKEVRSEVGWDDLVTKPFEMNEIREKIVALLEGLAT